MSGRGQVSVATQMDGNSAATQTGAPLMIGVCRNVFAMTVLLTVSVCTSEGVFLFRSRCGADGIGLLCSNTGTYLS